MCGFGDVKRDKNGYSIELPNGEKFFISKDVYKERTSYEKRKKAIEDAMKKLSTCAKPFLGNEPSYIVFDECKPKDDDFQRNWTFPVQHELCVHIDEILPYLSKENPLIFIKYSPDDRQEKVNVILHNSLVAKARIVYEVPFNVMQMNDTTFFAFDIKNSISEIISWAKKVKKMSWGDKKLPSKVTVIVPKI